MTFADRVLTIVVTATLTSAAWIVFGASWLDRAQDRQREDGSLAALEEEPGGAEPSTEAARGDVGMIEQGAAAPQGLEPRDSTRAADLVIPVAGIAPSDLSDSFLDDRGRGGARTHEAIDIMAPAGTKVVAAADGTIAKLHLSDQGGNAIYVRSPDRLRIHYYAHLRQYASGLTEGQRVRAGQTLGTVGSSGNADPAAPHLHYAILETTEDARWWEPATAINPYPLLREASPARSR